MSTIYVGSTPNDAREQSDGFEYLTEEQEKEIRDGGKLAKTIPGILNRFEVIQSGTNEYYVKYNNSIFGGRFTSQYTAFGSVLGTYRRRGGTSSTAQIEDDLELWTPQNMRLQVTAWYKADSISGTDGSAQSSWSDSSRNSNHASQGNTSRYPTLQTNEIGTHPVVRFDGANDFYTSTDIADLDVGTGDIWMAIVFKAAADGTIGFMFEKGVNQFGLMHTKNGELQARLGGTSNIPKHDDGNWSRTSFVLVTASRVSSTCNGFVDGSPMDTTGTTNTGSINNSDVLDIGATAIGGHPLNGDIAELIIGGHTLSDANRLKIEGYLAHKYGLEGNLPSDHLYKSSAPINE